MFDSTQQRPGDPAEVGNAPGPDAMDPTGADPEEDLGPEDVAEPPVTGDPDVDAALHRLSQVVRGSLPDQVAGYEAAHRALQDRLADVED